MVIIGGLLLINLVIADDNIDFTHNLSTMLAKEKDLRILNICRNGLQAIAACYSLKPDILILDLDMPGYSGLDVLKVLSSEQKTSSINVIVVSGNFDYRASITYASNINYIFSKPIEYEILIDKIREIKKSSYTIDEIRKTIYNLLDELKFNMHSKGTHLLINSIELAYQNPEYILHTADLMKQVAKLNHSHNQKSIRSTIDKSITAMYTQQENLDLLCEFFPEFCGYKPTTKTLIDNTVKYINGKF